MSRDVDSDESRDNLSDSSGWDGHTEEVAVDPTMVPGLLARGLPTRLAAERDVMAVLAAAFVAAALIAVATALVTWDGRIAPGPWPLFALIVPHLLVLAAVLAAAYLTLPAARWLAPEDLARRRRPPLLRLSRVLGVLALPVHPLLESRERRERGRILGREEVERALLTLLGLPRAAAGLVLGGLVGVALSDALIAGHQLLWSWSTTLGHLALWLALAGPIAVLAAAGVRQAVRADILAAPQATLPLRDPPPMTRGLRHAAGLTLLAAAVGPLMMAELWVQAQTRTEVQRTAERSARSLLGAAAPGQEVELGRLLAEIPGAAVRTAAGASYGAPMPLGTGPSGQVGPAATEARADFLTLTEDGATAAVAITVLAATPNVKRKRRPIGAAAHCFVT